MLVRWLPRNLNSPGVLPPLSSRRPISNSPRFGLLLPRSWPVFHNPCCRPHPLLSPMRRLKCKSSKCTRALLVVPRNPWPPNARWNRCKPEDLEVCKDSAARRKVKVPATFRGWGPQGFREAPVSGTAPAELKAFREGSRAKDSAAGRKVKVPATFRSWDPSGFPQAPAPGTEAAELRAFREWWSAPVLAAGWAQDTHLMVVEPGWRWVVSRR